MKANTPIKHITSDGIEMLKKDLVNNLEYYETGNSAQILLDLKIKDRIEDIYPTLEYLSDISFEIPNDSFVAINNENNLGNLYSINAQILFNSLKNLSVSQAIEYPGIWTYLSHNLGEYMQWRRISGTIGPDTIQRRFSIYVDPFKKMDTTRDSEIFSIWMVAFILTEALNAVKTEMRIERALSLIYFKAFGAYRLLHFPNIFSNPRIVFAILNVLDKYEIKGNISQITQEVYMGNDTATGEFHDGLLRRIDAILSSQLLHVLDQEEANEIIEKELSLIIKRNKG